MFTFHLPYGKDVYICSICGASCSSENKITECESKGMPETTNFKAGGTIEIFDGAWRQGITSGLAHGKSPWVIREIFYAHPATLVSTPRNTDRFVPIHTLCFVLEKYINLTTVATITLTNKDLKLWMEGDKEGLINAGLIRR